MKNSSLAKRNSRNASASNQSNMKIIEQELTGNDYNQQLNTANFEKVTQSSLKYFQEPFEQSRIELRDPGNVNKATIHKKEIVKRFEDIKSSETSSKKVLEKPDYSKVLKNPKQNLRNQINSNTLHSSVDDDKAAFQNLKTFLNIDKNKTKFGSINLAKRQSVGAETNTIIPF